MTVSSQWSSQDALGVDSPLHTFAASAAHSSAQGYQKYRKLWSHEELLRRAARRANLSTTRFDTYTALLSGGDTISGFDSSVTTLVSQFAYEITESAELTRNTLDNDGVPTCTTEFRADKGWLPLRLFAIGEEVMGAVVRLPLFVIGDGSATLEALVRQELRRRNKYQYLSRRGPKSTLSLLASADLDRHQVPDQNQVTFISSEPDTQQAWGLSMDVFPQVSSDIKALAVNALWAIPGLSAAAVDISTPTLDSAQARVEAVVPGVNLQEFSFPAIGKARHMHLALMRKIADNAAQLRSMNEKSQFLATQV